MGSRKGTEAIQWVFIKYAQEWTEGQGFWKTGVASFVAFIVSTHRDQQSHS